jgi:hypothetical protein
VLERLIPSQNPSGVVYGVIAIGALLAAESGRHESYVDTVGSAALAACLYWLAHAYATVLGRRLAHEELLTPLTLLRALMQNWAIFRGAAVPLGALMIAWAAGAAQETAVNVALWCAVATVVTFEITAGVRSRARPAELALQVGVGLVMGLSIIALKILLH